MRLYFHQAALRQTILSILHWFFIISLQIPSTIKYTTASTHHNWLIVIFTGDVSNIFLKKNNLK